MRFLITLLILLIPSFSYGMSDAERIKALEQKVESLMPQVLEKGSYNAQGVKKQGVKNPYHHKKGFHFESQDGKFSTNIQWRAQMRFSSGNLSDPTEESDISGPRTVQDFELRRVRMKVGGHGYKYVKYYFEIDLQPSRSISSDPARASSRIIDWRIDVQPYEWFGFRVGQWKINYNRERVDSSGRQTFVERSIVNSVFTIDRQVGVMAKGRLNKGTAADMRYYAGIFNGEGRAVQNNSDSLMKMARIQWNPLGRDLKWRQSDVKRHAKPTLSIAGAWAGNTGSCTRWSSSGCGGLDGLGADTGNPDRYQIDQYVAEVAYKHQGFALQSEYHWKNISDGETLEDHEMEGAYVNVSYFFNEVIPTVPEELELAFRYAFVDEPNSTRTIQENKRQEFTWGANYFIGGHGNKITADFSYLTLDDRRLDDRFDETRFRLQWDISI